MLCLSTANLWPLDCIFHFIIHWFIIPSTTHFSQSLAVSPSHLISHLTVPDLNKIAALYLCFLLIHSRQHCNHCHCISDMKWHLTLSLQSDSSMNYCNSSYYCDCWDSSVSEIQSDDTRERCEDCLVGTLFFIISLCSHTVSVLCNNKGPQGSHLQ